MPISSFGFHFIMLSMVNGDQWTLFDSVRVGDN